jgi:hypothetical protein
MMPLLPLFALFFFAVATRPRSSERERAALEDARAEALPRVEVTTGEESRRAAVAAALVRHHHRLRG